MKMIGLRDGQRYEKKAMELAEAKDWGAAKDEFVEGPPRGRAKVLGG
jgi:hypothetical protein